MSFRPPISRTRAPVSSPRSSQLTGCVFTVTVGSGKDSISRFATFIRMIPSDQLFHSFVDHRHMHRYHNWSHLGRAGRLSQPNQCMWLTLIPFIPFGLVHITVRERFLQESCHVLVKGHARKGGLGVNMIENPGRDPSVHDSKPSLFYWFLHRTQASSTTIGCGRSTDLRSTKNQVSHN